jgi:hypothetical protein
MSRVLRYRIVERFSQACPYWLEQKGFVFWSTVGSFPTLSEALARKSQLEAQGDDYRVVG